MPLKTLPQFNLIFRPDFKLYRWIAIYFFLALILIIMRMQSVEMDYLILDENKIIRELHNETKMLQATRAKFLAHENLRILAKEFNLEDIKQYQIMIIE